jgi:hypothetical protein
MGGGGLPPFAANAIEFDGTNDYGTLFGSNSFTDGAFLASVWLYVETVGTNIVLYDSGSGFRLFTDSGSLHLYIGNGSGALLDATLTDLGVGWHHICFSADNAPRASVWVDDVDQMVSPVTGNANWDRYNTIALNVGHAGGGAAKLNGGLADLFMTNEWLDLDVTANRRKLITAAGKPAYLGADGSLVTGTQPIVYLGGANDYDTWDQNLGSDGDLTVIGALSAGDAWEPVELAA